MEKAATYKMKKNLEVPPFFKGNSFDALDRSEHAEVIQVEYADGLQPDIFLFV